MTLTANDAWLDLLSDVMEHGHESRPRDYTTRELLVRTSVVPMRQPVVTVKNRALGYRFLAAEAAWILSGDNRLSSIAPYSRHIGKFSDDGLTFYGAYGPPFVDQAPYAVDALRRDISTRQAVVTTWRPRPGATKDVPCTVALQWLARDGRLNCAATMRSSDAWLGWPYDVHAFSMMSAHVALSLRATGGPRLELGDLYLTAGSQHLYQRDWGEVEATVADPAPWGSVAPLMLGEFAGPDELRHHLWATAREDDTMHSWLCEVNKFRGSAA